MGRGELGVTALGKHCRKQDDEVWEREPFQEPGTPAQSHPSSRRAAGAWSRRRGVLGLCSRKAGARAEGRQCGPPSPEGGASGGLRRCEARPRGPGTWPRQPCHAPFPGTWGVIASVSWTRTLRSMRDEVPTGRSKGGLDTQARADLSYHLPSWTIVDKRVRHLWNSLGPRVQAGPCLPGPQSLAWLGCWAVAGWHSERRNTGSPRAVRVLSTVPTSPGGNLTQTQAGVGPILSLLTPQPGLPSVPTL